jgi:predicted phosphodiesterase
VKIALLSDVHANLPALEAVLADLDRRADVDAVYHLGDLVGYAPWPDQTVTLLRSRGIPGVAGNYDSTTATDHEHCGCRYEDPHQAELAHLSYEWTRARVSAGTKRFLSGLPFRLDVRPLGGHVPGPRLILVHASPTMNTLYWTEDKPDSFCAQMIGIAGAAPGDVLAFGHTHKPWRRVVEGVHLVNTGSVGKPKDGDARAGYAVVTLGEGAPSSEQIRVPYDIAHAMKGIQESGLPVEFAEDLRTGVAAPESMKDPPGES